MAPAISTLDSAEVLRDGETVRLPAPSFEWLVINLSHWLSRGLIHPLLERQGGSQPELTKVNLSIIYLIFLFFLSLFIYVYYQLIYSYIFMVLFTPLICLFFIAAMTSILFDTTKHFGPITVTDVNFEITGTKYVLFYRPGKSTITTKLKRFIDMYRFRHICIPFDIIKEYQLFYVKWKPGTYAQPKNLINSNRYFYIGTEIVTTDGEKYWFANWIFDEIRELLEAPSNILTLDSNGDFKKIPPSKELYKKVYRTHGFYITLRQRIFSTFKRDVKINVTHALILSKQQLTGNRHDKYCPD